MSAKDIEIKLIEKKYADASIMRYHYSGKTVKNNNFNFGIFYNNALLGALQFGPPTDKRKMLPLVTNTQWNGMIELNRLACSDDLPQFTETRAISQCIKFFRMHYPQIKWIISFADGTQCGHGTIYQAANFHLIQIKKNNSLIQLPNGEIINNLVLGHKSGVHRNIIKKEGLTELQYLNIYHLGWYRLPGHMFKYIFFLDKKYKKNLTVPILPYSQITQLQLKMYKGQYI